MPKLKKHVRISHNKTVMLLAEGPFGFCFYKFFYVWMDLKLEDGKKVSNLGWLYWLPNPLFPFIWFRVGIPQMHPELVVEEFELGKQDLAN